MRLPHERPDQAVIRRWRQHAAAQEALSADQRWRKHQFRHIAVLVTLPGVLLGTASFAAAYGSGLFDHSSDTTQTCRPTIALAPKPGSFSLQIQNATGLGGLGGTVAHDLTRRGYHVTNISTADLGLYVKTAGRIYYGKQGLDQALLVQEQVPGSEMWFDGRPGTGVTLVIGNGFVRLAQAPPPVPPVPSQVHVNVYNTTFMSGLASTVGKDLADRGFKIDKTGNEPNGAYYPEDRAVIRYGEDGDLAAELLAEHIQGARLVKDGRSGTDVDLVLASRWVGVVPPANVPAPAPRPKRPPATVERPCNPF